VMWLLWSLVSVHSVMVSVLEQDRYTVCTKPTIGSKSFWTHLIVLIDDEAQVKAHFGPFGDSANLDSR
jgi:hypothetical protein